MSKMTKWTIRRKTLAPATILAVGLIWTGAGCDHGCDIDAPPALSITAPADQAIVWGTVEITVAASDDIGVDRVEFYVNGLLVPAGLDITPPYSCSWDTRAFPENEYADLTYVIHVKAYDTRGNSSTRETALAVRRITETDETAEPIGAVDPGDWCSGPSLPRFRPAYPNPASDGTYLGFDLNRVSDVVISVLTAAGAPVKVLAYQDAQPGSHRVLWDGRDTEGAAVPAGMYRAVMTAGEFTCGGDILIDQRGSQHSPG